MVRKKAVCALHRFYTRDEDSVSHLSDVFRRALCDKGACAWKQPSARANAFFFLLSRWSRLLVPFWCFVRCCWLPLPLFVPQCQQ
jgi:hypothetical protein